MATCVLPEGKELPIEADVVRPLLRAALLSALTDLRPMKVEVSQTSGFVWADGRIEEAELPLPKYDRFHPDPTLKIWQTPAAKDLTDYIWSRGALKLTLSKDDGEPTQEGWASFTWSHLVLRPLSYIATRAAMEDLTLGRNHAPWRVPDDALEDAISELVGLLTGGNIIVFATCPLIAIHLGGFDEEIDRFELGDGIVLSEWSWTQDQVVFISQHGQEFRRDEGLWNSRVLQIRASVPASKDPVVAIAEIVDKIKWAFAIAESRGTSIHELPIIIRSATGHARDVLRRGAQNFGMNEHRAGRPLGWVETKGWHVLNATSAVLERAKEALAAFDKVSPRSGDLSDAIWSFGRSCVASLPRGVAP